MQHLPRTQWNTRQQSRDPVKVLRLERLQELVADLWCVCHALSVFRRSGTRFGAENAPTRKTAALCAEVAAGLA
jgi:hypothetical protein